MKRQSILFVRSMWVVILFTTLAACKDTDNRVFGDDFEFPALTDENTIRFTVNVVGDWRQLDIVASGGTNGDRLGKRSYTENRRSFFNEWRSGI